MAGAFPDQVAIADTPAAFREIVASGRLAVVVGLQNAAPFHGDLDAIRAWAARGVQILAFAFIGNNAFADSARPYPFAGDFDNGGLSPSGARRWRSRTTWGSPWTSRNSRRPPLPMCCAKPERR